MAVNQQSNLVTSKNPYCDLYTCESALKTKCKLMLKIRNNISSYYVVIEKNELRSYFAHYQQVNRLRKSYEKK